MNKQNTLTRIKDCFFNLKGKARQKMLFLMATLTCLAFEAESVFAKGTGNGTIDGILGGIIGQLYTVFKAVGVMLLFAGIVMMFLAFKDEDGSAKTRAGMMIGIGAALMSIETIMNSMNIV